MGLSGPIRGAPSQGGAREAGSPLGFFGSPRGTNPQRLKTQRTKAGVGGVRAPGSCLPILRVLTPAWPALRLTLPGGASQGEQRRQLPSDGARRSLKRAGRAVLESALIGR